MAGGQLDVAACRLLAFDRGAGKIEKETAWEADWATASRACVAGHCETAGIGGNGGGGGRHIGGDLRPCLGRWASVTS